MKTLRVADRTRSFKYAVRDVLAVADEAKKAGKSMLYLNIGDPNVFDFALPEGIIESVTRALRDGHTSYAPSEGVPAALEAIRAESEGFGFQGIRDVFVGNGASEAIEIVLTALCNRGEGVLLPYPGYPLYTAIAGKLGIDAQPYYLDEANGWRPNADDIRAHIQPNTRALVLINPNNPTGSVYDRACLQELIEIALEHELVILSDEIYAKLTLDGREHLSIASLSDRAPIITFNGLSKAFLAPGLRVGWAIVSGPELVLAPLVDACHKLLRARLCASHPMQYAIAPALADTRHLPEVIAKLERRRDLTVSRLDAIDGISCVAPEAAFYAFPSLHIEGPDERFVAEMVRETGVVVVHGSGFGERPDSSHFRVVYLPTEPVLSEAFDRLEAFMRRHL